MAEQEKPEKQPKPRRSGDDVGFKTGDGAPHFGKRHHEFIKMLLLLLGGTGTVVVILIALQPDVAQAGDW